jgi:hypothetical protein
VDVVAEMTSQQEADCALALWRSHKGDDQERMDSILKEFFAQVRADEYEEIQRRVSEIFACPVELRELCA